MSVYGIAERAFPETQREITAATIAGSPGTYMGVGTSFDHPVRLYFLQNLTDSALQFSWDGVNDHFPLPSNGFILIDVASNAMVNKIWIIGQGVRTYVKTLGVPTAGSVYLTVFYGQGA